MDCFGNNAARYRNALVKVGVASIAQKVAKY